MLAKSGSGSVQVLLVPMTVHLSPHGRRLLEAATGVAATLPEEVRERRRQAVASMVASREEYHLTIGLGERIQDLIHEGHQH